MALENFRLLLLKKAAGNAAMENFICDLDEFELEGAVLESLEKEGYGHKGSNNNEALKEFAASTLNDPIMIDMARHSVGHHVSQYKAALKAGNKSLASQHANQAFRTVNMLERARKDISHHPEAYDIGTVSPHPWQHNYTPRGRGMDVGRLSDPEWAKVYGSKGEPQYPTRSHAYEHLRMSPSEGRREHREIAGLHENSAYPFEKIQIGGAYIPVDHDVESSGKFKEHAFDRHPVMKHGEIPIHKFGEKGGPLHQQYQKEEEEFVLGPHYSKFLDMKDKAHAEHGEDKTTNPFYGHKVPSMSVHDPLPEAKPREAILRQPKSAPTSAPTPTASSAGELPHLNHFKQLMSLEQAHGIVSSPGAKKVIGDHINKIHKDTGGVLRNPQGRQAYEAHLGGKK